jgi:hypothetical protein
LELRIKEKISRSCQPPATDASNVSCTGVWTYRHFPKLATARYGIERLVTDDTRDPTNQPLRINSAPVDVSAEVPSFDYHSFFENPVLERAGRHGQAQGLGRLAFHAKGRPCEGIDASFQEQAGVATFGRSRQGEEQAFGSCRV